MKLESAEEPENVRTVFFDAMAIMSFTKAFKITHQPTGASFGATSRMTETFVWAGGEWKVVAFQETMVSKPTRQMYRPAGEHFDDYVQVPLRRGRPWGRDSGDAPRESALRKLGDRQTSRDAPGTFDTFFTPGFPILERFVRDRRGRVVGIVYTLGDSEVGVKRVQ